MGRAVLLRHELPDGSVHFDWMIQPRAGAGLITFRVGVRIDQPGVRSFGAQRLVRHREAYLDYQGPVSADRGTVARVAEGTLEIEVDSDREFACRGELAGVHVCFRGLAAGDGWKFLVEAE